MEALKTAITFVLVVLLMLLFVVGEAYKLSPPFAQTSSSLLITFLQSHSSPGRQQ
jgi:hypothetical protein